MYDIINDLTPTQAIRKSAQVGFTTSAILKSFWLASMKNLNCIYTLPTMDDVSKFGKGKVNEMVNYNPFLKSLVPDIDSIGQKKVGDRFIYYQASFTEKEAIMVSSDCNFYDEMDRCFEPDTEILTKKGWKKIQEITLKDKMLTLNPINWNISYKYPKNIIKLKYNGDFYRIKANSLDIGITKNHKLWAKTKQKRGYDLYKIEDLYKKPFTLTSKANWHFFGKDTGYIYIPHINTYRKPRGSNLLKPIYVSFKTKKVLAKEWYQFLGWYLSEGHIARARIYKNHRKITGQIIISQKNKKNIKEIVNIIKKLSYKPHHKKDKIYFNDLHLALYLGKLGNSYNKFIPKKYLYGNKKYLPYLLETLLKGDGDKRNVYTTCSKKLADDIQILCLRIKKTASIYKVNNKGKIIYKVGIIQSPYRKFNKFNNSSTKATVLKENYKGDVYCIEVQPYHIVLVRGKEKKIPIWSGNSNLSVIEAYHSRLQASKYKYEYFFSNPSYPNVGVDKYWQASDQKHWFINCKKCNEWQYLDWQDNIDYEREIFICKKCHNELTNEDRRVGKWVKKWSDKNVSGYWISQMMIPWQSAKELIYLEKNKDKQYFYNFILGQPYIGSDILVNKDLILRNISTEDYETDKVFIGIDVGVEKHFVIGNKDGIFQVGKTSNWADIESLIIKYNAVFVIDGMPDITEPRRLIQKFRGKGFIVFYKEDLKTSDLATFEKEKKYGVITADRTRLIETMIDKHIKSQIKYFVNPNELQEYVSHWESLYRVEEEDRFQNKKIRWEHSGADHFVHASVYYEIAKLRGGEAMVIQEEKNLLVGEKSFVVSKEGTIPAISIKEFISKPENDWRYK
jgi:hypothetical protein